MIYVLGGLALALVYTAAALVLAVWARDLSWFVDIRIACNVMFSPLAECRQEALSAGTQTLAGLLLGGLVMVGLFVRMRRRSGKDSARWALPPDALRRSRFYQLFLIGTATLLSAHYLYRLFSPLQVERLAILSQESTFASLENLCWPILLQLYVAERSRVGRYLALALLLTMATLTFFRAMQLAVLVFGVGIFLLDALWRFATDRSHRKQAAFTVVERLTVGVFLAILFLSAVKTDTLSRESLTALPEASASATGDGQSGASRMETPSDGFGNALATAYPNTGTPPMDPSRLRIVQRIIFPLYQASLAKAMGATVELPDPGDDLARKFRLNRNPNLNEFLYRTLYGYHPVGQTTSLLYGEAAAWTTAPPLIWITSVLLIYALLAVAGYRLAIPVGLLIGLAIWRGFNGGSIDIIPSLVIQLTVLTAIAWTSRTSIKDTA